MIRRLPTLHVAAAHGGSACRSLRLIGSCFLLLSGCSRPAPEPVTLTLLDQEWTTKHFLDVRKQELEDFTRKTGIVVKYLPCPESAWEQLALWRRMLASGAAGADVYGLDVIWPALLSDSLMDLRPFFGQDLSAHFPAVLGSYTVDDKLVALPRSAGIGLLYYRTDLLRDYGYREPPKTWDELGTMAARIQSGERTKGKKDFWGFVWQGAAAESLTCNALEWQTAEGGGRILEADKTVSVNNPHAIRAWERAARWVGSVSPRSVVAYKEWDALNVWVAGNAAFMRNWTVALVDSQAPSSAVHDRFGVTLLPGGRGGRFGTLGGTGLAVSRFTPHPQEAVALVRHLCSRGAQLKRVGLLFDIEDRRRAEEERRVSEARFRNLVEFAADAFMLHADDGTVLDVNRHACESLGYSRDELIGMKPAEFDAGLDTANLQRVFERIAVGETLTFETRHRRKDGTVFPVEVRGRQSQMVHGDRRFGISLSRDITERRQADEERERLRQMEAGLARINRVTTMGELTASLAHEVHQPIAAAVTSANACLRWLARDPPDVESARQSATRAAREGTRAGEIIHRVRSMYKKSAPPVREPLDVNDVTREMLARDEEK